MCDLRICSESSRFGVPINRIGVIMAYPEIEALIDLVGRATTLEILLEGRAFSAQEAKEKNLVTRVVPDDELEKNVYESARRIADGAPHSNRLHKKFARRLLDLRPLTADEDEGFASASFDDYQEGYDITPSSKSASRILRDTSKSQVLPTDLIEEFMTTSTNVNGPLHGLKVIEITHIMAGPTCGLMLVDLGAQMSSK